MNRMPINTKNRQGKEQEIPFFPLSIVISPGEKVPLRIFEPRYIELISHIELSGEQFAIPFLHQSEVTCLGSIVKLSQIVDKYPNGEMTILIEGVQFCEIVDYSPKLPCKLYGGGKVKPYANKRYSSNKVLIYYLSLLDWNKESSIMLTDEVADVVGILQKLQLTNFEKYTILQQKSKEKMDKLLINYLNYYKMLFYQERMLKNNFDLN